MSQSVAEAAAEEEVLTLDLSEKFHLFLFFHQAAVEDQEDGAHQVLEGQAAALVDTEEEEDPITGVRGASEP